MVTAYAVFGHVRGYAAVTWLNSMPTLYKHRPGLKVIAWFPTQEEAVRAMKLLITEPAGHA